MISGAAAQPVGTGECGSYISSSTNDLAISRGTLGSRSTKGPSFKTGSSSCNDRLLHGARPVARVEGGVILELLQPRTKPLIRVVKVVRNTRTEHVQEGKT